MKDKQTDAPDELQAWIREQLDSVVKTFADSGVFNDAFIEVRPSWTLPHRILIGKAREPGDSGSSRWFISGELRMDHVDSTVAASPRDVMRHFAIKWQLDASQAAGGLAKTLIEQAEAIYPLTNDDQLWDS